MISKEQNKKSQLSEDKSIISASEQDAFENFVSGALILGTSASKTRLKIGSNFGFHARLQIEKSFSHEGILECIRSDIKKMKKPIRSRVW